MSNLHLKPISVSKLEVYANPHDALHDLHIYVQYMSTRVVKRMTRNNAISKADTNRLIKQMTNPLDLAAIVNADGSSGWLDFIDTVARQLGLVNYNIEGVYRGYSSSSPSYIKNYIIVSDQHYRKFMALPPAEQEKRIFEKLITRKSGDRYDRSSDNEFYTPGVIGRLDGFSTWGSATGIMPTLNFAKIRKFLLGLLETCQPGEWYSVASLVAFLKANHRYCIIPKKIKTNRWGNKGSRYDNFHEGPDHWHNSDSVPDDSPDGFERVEGRYIERFLENIPLILRFVELAYDPRPYTKKVYPMIGYLQAFRVTGRFIRLISGTPQLPKVTVQPNFEIVVESEFYPAQTLQQLEIFAEPVPAPAGGTPVSVSTLTLKKKRVAAALVSDPDLDVSTLLERMSASPLPPNVATEIGEWSGHAEMFTLYEGFGLLEIVDALPDAEAFTRQEILPNLRLVNKPQKLLTSLEHEGLAPIGVAHGSLDFTTLPNGVHSLFPKLVPVQEAEPLPPEPVTLRKVVSITLNFPFDEVFDAFRRALAEARVPVQADAGTRSLTFPNRFMPALEKVIEQFNTLYDFQIQEE